MTAYLIISYDIADADRFADYNPGKRAEIGETINNFGGRVLAGGPAEATVGSAPSTTVLVSFPDVEAAKAWQSNDAYAPLKAIRYEATTNISEVLVEGR